MSNHKPRIAPTLKQHEAWEALSDKQCKYVGFGGGAGGGKSWLGAEWLITNCYIYSGSKWFMGRNELSRLMKSSYVTYQKACSFHKIPRNDWALNGQYNFIEFKNGSRIDLLDMAYKPSDPMYERFGSLEYTGGWIEEAGEIDFRAFDVLKSRIGRHENSEYGLIPAKLLLTFNPKKNWLYQLFYKPHRDEELPKEYVFIQSLYGDNPYTADTYGEDLAQIKDKATKQRLMFGNWDYEDSPRALFGYDPLSDIFSNTIEKKGEKYLTVDIAGEGKDKTIFYFWEDLEFYRIEEYQWMNTDSIIDKIREYASQEKIPYSHIAVDAIGNGEGVATSKMLDGIIGYKGSYQAIKTDESPVRLPNIHYLKNAPLTSEYKNLRSQCIFKLSEMVNNHKMAGRIEDIKIKEKIIEELSVYQDETPDDGKRVATKKEDVKELLGRSSDYSDPLIMRMYFEIKEALLPYNSEEAKRVFNKLENQFARNEGRQRFNSTR